MGRTKKVPASPTSAVDQTTIDDLRSKVTDLEAQVQHLQGQVADAKLPADKVAKIHTAVKESSNWESFKNFFTGD